MSSLSCGKVAPPLPPLPPLPTVQNVTGTQTGGALQLEFTLSPEQGPIIEVLVACGAERDVADYRVMARAPRSKLEPGAAQDRFVFRTARPPSPPCSYVLRFEDSSGRRSPISEPVDIL